MSQSTDVKQPTSEEVLKDLCYCVYHLDNKPHKLFAALVSVVERFEEDADTKKECIRQLTALHNNERGILTRVIKVLDWNRKKNK